MWRGVLVRAPMHHCSSDSQPDQGVPDLCHSSPRLSKDQPPLEPSSVKGEVVAQPDHNEQSLVLQAIARMRSLSACPAGS